MRRAFWIILIALLLLTRIPTASKFFIIDNVNLAFALDKFDPRLHQPQPPGYPFFVGFARIVNVFFGDAEMTFFVISILVTGLCLPVIAALGTRFMSPRVGQTAAVLLLLSPPFWQAGLFSPLRPNLALFSLLTAYAAWRSWKGERQYIIWGAVALGIGSGFRPDLLEYLFPLWLVSAVVGTRSVKAVVQGAVVLGAIVLVWVGALAFATGGPSSLYHLMKDYAADQSAHGSVLLDVDAQSWRRQIGRLIIWNGMAAIGWLWAVPVALIGKNRKDLGLERIAFLAVWLIPGLLFQALVHVEEPGHTVFSIPAFCLLGGCIIWMAAERLSPAEPSRVSEPAVLAVVVLNVLMFMNYFPLPASPDASGLLSRVTNPLAYATYESSLAHVRWLDDISQNTMKELKALTPKDRPTIIVSDDVPLATWFMNWRIFRYYAPETDIWVLTAQRAPGRATRIRRDKSLESRTGDTVEIPVPQGGRIIWLLERGGPFDKALGSIGHREGLLQLAYTDVPVGGFQVPGFNFVPTPFRP